MSIQQNLDVRGIAKLIQFVKDNGDNPKCQSYIAELTGRDYWPALAAMWWASAKLNPSNPELLTFAQAETLYLLFNENLTILANNPAIKLMFNTRKSLEQHAASALEYWKRKNIPLKVAGFTVNDTPVEDKPVTVTTVTDEAPEPTADNVADEQMGVTRPTVWEGQTVVHNWACAADHFDNELTAILKRNAETGNTSYQEAKINAVRKSRDGVLAKYYSWLKRTGQDDMAASGIASQVSGWVLKEHLEACPGHKLGACSHCYADSK